MGGIGGTLKVYRVLKKSFSYNEVLGSYPKEVITTFKINAEFIKEIHLSFFPFFFFNGSLN